MRISRADFLPGYSCNISREILKACKIVNEVYLDEKIEQYIADIVFASRYPERYGLGELKT